MTYEVIITQKAQDQLNAAYEWLVVRTPSHAPGWYNQMVDAILSLAENPARCPRVDSSGDARYLLVGDKLHSYPDLLQDSRPGGLRLCHSTRVAIEAVVKT